MYFYNYREIAIGNRMESPHTHFLLVDFGNTCFNNIRIHAAINDSNLKVRNLGLFLRYGPIICLKTVSWQNCES